ncbi:putative E3 ubiquitin-protein ligase TRIML1 [Sminthopsis crassicaudata]|uniref:putative E3 ubiquitin-protein ligase TRIML1 n=1 Tax=Sminthopsis crassicaudata TaxID=9301 RepID=UPI003D684B0E
MLQPHLLQKELGLSTCDQHGERVMFFCEEDHRALCDSCLSAPEHKDHQVLPLETATDKCKNKLRDKWRVLQKKKEKLQTAGDTLRRREAQFTERSATLKESATSEYGKIHEFLWDEEYHFLKQLQHQYRDNVVNLEEKEHELSEHIKSLEQMMFQVEENLDKMPLEMIQEMPGTWKKKEELLLKKPELACVSWHTWSVTGMREMLMSFHKDITFDPESAHPHLLLSEDLKRIQYGSICQDLPDNKGRLDSSLVVLGAQEFTSGRHYWEVELGDKTEWELGICKDPIRRKGLIFFSSEHVRTITGSTSENEFFFWNSENGCHCSTSGHKVGIFLDYEMRYIAFYDGIYRYIIHMLSNLDFEGPLRPYFCAFLSNDGSTPGSLFICPKCPQ